MAVTVNILSMGIGRKSSKSPFKIELDLRRFS